MFDELQSTTLIVSETDAYGPFESVVSARGLKILGLGAVGGQEKVSDEFLEKVALTSNSMLDPTAKGIKKNKLKKGIKKMIKTGVIQRVGFGEYDEYDPILDSGKTKGWDQVNDAYQHTDFIWEMEQDDPNQITEVVEHLLHTYTKFLLPTVFKNDYLIFSSKNKKGRTDTLRLAVDEAIDNGVFFTDDYTHLKSRSEEEYYDVISTEYLFILTYAMWGYVERFVEGGSLDTEWSDNHLEPKAIKKDNPTGFKLYKRTVKKLIRKPSAQLLESLFI